MPAVAAGIAIISAGIQVYGAIKSADDQASLDQTRANIANEQAAEIASREAANEQIKDQQAYRQKLQFGASYAASGKAGVGLGGQLQIQNQTDQANMISNREAQFQENMLKQQSGIDTTLAGQTQEAGTIQALGAGISGVAAGAKLYTGAFSGTPATTGINGGG